VSKNNVRTFFGVRLAGAAAKNWAGQPLTSYEKMLNYIRTTTTETGLKVRAYLLPTR
jgi:hypothetical protein